MIKLHLCWIGSLGLNSAHWSSGQTVKQLCQYSCVVYSSTEADGLCVLTCFSNSPDIHRLIHRARCKHQHAGRERTCSHISTAERQRNIIEKDHLVRYTLQFRYMCVNMQKINKKDTSAHYSITTSYFFFMNESRNHWFFQPIRLKTLIHPGM